LVANLPDPTRPLRGGKTWSWKPNGPPWFRIYHRDSFCPTALAKRHYGPLNRFDHHRFPFGSAAEDPDRSVIYLAETLATSGAEVFGDTFSASVCPQRFVGRVVPTALIEVQDLVGNGAMLLGASQVLAAGDNPRPDTQQWARAIYDDNPPGRPVAGIRYSGAHQSGICLALWDRATALTIASMKAGQPADLPLTTPGVWHRFVNAMAQLSVVVTRIEAADCPCCQRFAAQQ
jgi:hypothetical protein